MWKLARTTLRNSPFFAPAALSTTIGCGLLAFVMGTDQRLRNGALAYPASQELQIVAASFPERGVSVAGLGSRPFLDLQSAQVGSQHEVAIPRLSTPRTLPLRIGEELLTVSVELVDHDTLQLLGVGAVAGRLLQPEDSQAAAPIPALGTYSLIAKLGERLPAELLGRRFFLKGKPVEIVGVTEPTYRGALWNSVDLVLPIDAIAGFEGPHYMDDAAVAWLLGVTRLADQAASSALDDLLDATSPTLRASYPEELDGLQLTSLPLQNLLLGNAAPKALGTLRWAAIGLYLLCVGSAILLVLALLEARRAEFEVRTALGGSSTSQIARSCLSLFPWALLAASLAIVGMRQLGPQLVRASGLTPPSTQVGRVAGFEIGCVLVLATLALLAQVFVVIHHFRSAASRPIGDGRQHRSAGRLRISLVTVQLAVALVLIAGAFATHAAVGRVLDQPSGLDDQILATPVSWSSDRDASTRRADRQQLSETIAETNPELRTAWIGPRLPPGLVLATTVRRTGDASEDAVQAFRSAVSDRALALLDIPLITGRWLDGRDQEGTEPSVLISESTAQALFGDADPLGVQLVAHPAIQGLDRWTVVGVVADIEGRGFGEPRLPNHDLYVSLRQAPEASLHLLAQSRDGQPAPASLSRSVANEFEGRAVVLAPRTLESHYADQADNERFARRLAALFSAFAVLVALAGLYGSLSLHLRQRQREMAIRAALGATPGSLVSLLASMLLRILAISALLGTVIAVGLFRWAALAESSLVHASAVPLLLSLAVISAGTILAALGPWLRLLRDDPSKRLRADSPWTP